MNDIEKLVTIDTIIEYLQDAVKSKTPLPPTIWLDAAQKLNVLLSEEEDRLFDLQQVVAQKKYDFIKGQAKKNVSEAKAYIEASDDYRDSKKQAAKIGRIVEFIRLAKIQARTRMEEMRGN
jgi:ElaB/YqjD/DUF883 family membrane-anchored ribosome-binding protein